MKSLIYTFFAAVILISCTEGIELDLRQTPSRVVIDGLVTNRAGYQSVKVTRSVDFYNTGKTPRVTNAIVTVEDDLGNVFNFDHNPNNHADSAGIYIAKDFVGQIGRTYKLSVQVDGEMYEARDKLVSVLAMDSLKYRVSELESEDPKVEGRIYEVLMFAREPQEVKNFYLFKFFRNDTITYYNDTDIYYSDDEFLAENIDGVPSPVYYAQSDTARVEVFSLSREGYVYFNDLFSLLNNDAGGMFGPIPSSPRTNLSNKALGFFQVSALNISEVKIE
jgi:hypothetical protein